MRMDIFFDLMRLALYPNTNNMESMTLDFPLPFGPTIEEKHWGKELNRGIREGGGRGEGGREGAGRWEGGTWRGRGQREEWGRGGRRDTEREREEARRRGQKETEGEGKRERKEIE